MQKEHELPPLAEIVSDAPDAPAGEKLIRDKNADPFLRRPSASDASSGRREEPLRRPASPETRAASLPEREYAYSPLLFSVSVSAWPQRYNYYQRFLCDAERYFRVRGEPCETEGYFSYIPQYSQLSRPQLAFYFWFRERARSGEYADDVDFPYILLYVYEIINLPRLIAPDTGAAALAGLWLAYRRRYPELDKYLAEWMCDYCLVHGVQLPKTLAPILPEIIRRASLKEFYVSAMPGAGNVGELPPEVLVAAGSDYNYRSSRYYGDNAALYEEHIPAAAAYAMKRCGLWSGAAEELRTARAERDAFCGSLCAQTVKRRIRISYYSLSRSYELRASLTQAVKLAENGVRRAAKIKSRLNVAGADRALAAAVAEYFSASLPGERRRRAEEENAYERYYDAPSVGFDFAGAHSIESASWANAELLAPAESSAPAEPPAPAESSAPAQSSTPAQGSRVPLPALLAWMLDGGQLEEWCRRQPKRLLPEVAAAQINDYFADELGDVVLACADGAWRLIEDYRQEAEDALGRRS